MENKIVGAEFSQSQIILLLLKTNKGFKIFYYEVILTKNSTPILTYSYFREIENLRYIIVPLENIGLTQAIVYREVKREEIKFPISKMRSIKEVLDLYIPYSYFKSVIFMKNYYFSTFPSVLKFLHPHPINYGEMKYQKSNLTFTFSEDQQMAFDKLKKSRVSLLFGDTGSGKTLLYKKRIDEVLNSGGDILFLVPEINLIPQISSRVSKAFGNIVDSWHSKRSKKDKNEILKKIYSRDIRVIIGTLSSLFLPFKNLSLIVVDEEHSESYSLEEDRVFRFNARDMAIYLGNELNIPVILGSATPSLNSYVKFPSTRLKGQFFKGEKQYIFDKSDFGLNESILKKIDERLKKNEQTIVFIPTRGNFKYLNCTNCDESYSCKNCSIRLTLYKKENYLKCNRCGYLETIPNICKSCGDDELEVSKAGTVEISTSLQDIFPKANILNFDSDRVKKLKDVTEILSDFSQQKIDILVGTQMIAKGHDYPNVTLSVILGLDFAINLTDFQSYEKTLSLVIQLAGRSGRVKDSDIIIQTKYEKFYKKYIEDYEKFLKFEISNRENLFPPYVNFIRLLIEDISETGGRDILDHIELYTILFSNIEIFISGEAPVKKVEKKHRFHLVLKTDKLADATPFVKEMLQLIPKNFRKKMAVEINPTSYS